MKSLDKKELKELLNKGWMTHDGMWFYHCLQECGIEKTNKINKAAVKSMAMVEGKRIRKALGIKDFQTFEEIKELIEGGLEIIKADFMNFIISFPLENVLHWEIPNCFAYEGIKTLGIIEQYECGIFYRADGWFESLGIRYSATPPLEGCLMHTDGKCARDYRFYLD